MAKRTRSAVEATALVCRCKLCRAARKANTGICALPGCGKPVPKAARDHQDVFHASTCFRVAHGTATQQEADESQEAAERGAEAADRGGWRRKSEATFERAYGRRGRKKREETEAEAES